MAAGAPDWVLDEKTLEQAMHNFHAMDTNKDGKLSLSEFREGLGMLGKDERFCVMLFAAFDKGGDGYVDMREFLAAMGVMLHPDDVKQQISLAFEAYDLNKDGKLQLDELKSVIRAIFSVMYSMGMKGAAYGYTADAADRTAEELFGVLDSRGQGFVTKEDYEELALANPDLIKQIGLGGGSHSRRRVSRSHSLTKHRRFSLGRARKAGTTVTFGHERWELVVQMMLGIRMSLSVGGAESEDTQRAQPAAGSASAATRANLSASGVNAFAHASAKFDVPTHRKGRDGFITFKDYYPLVFRRIRQHFGLTESEYQLSLGPEQILGEMLLGSLGSLSELFSEGKSGSFFYFSNDGLFLIKTIPHREARSLSRLLPQYLSHVEANPHTLLPRYYGFHRLQLPTAGKVHFVVMANVFSTERKIHERYDLKGSYLGRTVGPELREKREVVRKDLDLRRQFYLGGARRERLLEQVERDVGFLKLVQTMDYSLLCGIHYPEQDASYYAPSASLDASQTPGLDSSVGAASLGPFADRERPPWVDHADGAIEAHNINIGAPPELYFIGIIDVLTAFTPAKVAESVFKQTTHPAERKGVSCVPPDQYADRFLAACGQKWIA